MVDGGVEHRHTREQLGVIDRPTEGDDAAPVMPERDDGAFEPEVVGEGRKVGDALSEWAVDAGALRESHVEMIDGDDSPGGRACRRGLDRRRDHLSP